MLTAFQNSFTGRVIVNFAVVWSFRIPPHL